MRMRDRQADTHTHLVFLFVFSFALFLFALGLALSGLQQSSDATRSSAKQDTRVVLRRGMIEVSERKERERNVKRRKDETERESVCVCVCVKARVGHALWHFHCRPVDGSARCPGRLKLFLQKLFHANALGL